MSKYFKNFILCGDADFHCLLCRETFQSLVLVEKHIRWEQHRKVMKNQTCLPKFKNDHIYKIENIYYCALCNDLMPNMNTTIDHTKEEKHAATKTNPGSVNLEKPIGQHDSGFVIIQNVLISKLQWNGIINDNCVLCNTYLKDVDKHINSTDHVLKLIQSEFKFVNSGQYYREINKNLYQCFACNVTLRNSDFNDHWSQKAHMGRTDKVLDKILKSEDVTYKRLVLKYNDFTELELKLIKTQIDKFDIDLINKMAVCKECASHVKCNFNALIKHKDTHKSNDNHTKEGKKVTDNNGESSDDEVVYTEICDHGKRRSELSKYGKQNFITMNEGGSKGYCTLCDRYFSAHKKLFKEHIKGMHHNSMLELKGLVKTKTHEIPPNENMSLCLYLKQIVYDRELNSFSINGFLISKNSFILIKPILNNAQYRKTKCYACDTSLMHGAEADHCKSSEHKTNFIASKVLRKGNEFIREVRRNLFHCGFCNLVFPFWEPLKKHLKSLDHLKQKHVSYWNGPTLNYVEVEPSKNNETLFCQLMDLEIF